MSKSSESDEAPLETEPPERTRKKLTFEVFMSQDHLGESEQSTSTDETDIAEEICSPFCPVDKIAEKFIENLLNEAAEETKNIKSVINVSKGKQDEDDVTVASVSLRTFTEDFDYLSLWPRIQDFTIDAGMEAIQDYMSNWYYDEDWIYNLQLVLMQSDDCSDYYIYEVRWGIPTKSYPVPQATASVFFTLDVSRVKPPECQIDVGLRTSLRGAPTYTCLSSISSRKSGFLELSSRSCASFNHSGFKTRYSLMGGSQLRRDVIIKGVDRVFPRYIRPDFLYQPLS